MHRSNRIIVVCLVCLFLATLGIMHTYKSQEASVSKMPYDYHRIPEFEGYDSVSEDTYPLMQKGEKHNIRPKAKKTSVFMPVNTYTHIPEAECTVLGTKYLAYKYRIYVRKGLNTRTRVYEGERVPKGTNITVCYSFDFHNGIAFVRGCAVQYVRTSSTGTEVAIIN